ncbi:MAG: S8 family serine peptidase, partial [Saprospiraceae bacterium]|nr:S8 family serine peptidase [Saprospiraceae bacterium]
MKFITVIVAFIVLGFPMGSNGQLPAQTVSSPTHEEILVQLEEEADPDRLFNRRSLSPLYQALSYQRNIYALRVPAAQLPTWEEHLSNMKEVVGFQRNYDLHFRQVPSDPLWSRQWGLERIGAERVWDVSRGGETEAGDEIVVAILDDGFDIEHEDLQQNLWVNRGEIPGDGIDNDENGYIDDYRGWNFVNASPDHPPTAHGTSVAGIVGAAGDNDRGIAGINWNVRLMLLTVADAGDVIQAYDYAIDQKRRYLQSAGREGAFVVVTNLSAGIEELFCDQQPVWRDMYDFMGSVGILSSTATADINYNVDEVGDMPTTCPSNFLLAVLNSDRQDQKAGDSAYGTMSIDLAAPG